MTTLGREKSALLVIDVQNQVVEGAYNKDQVISNINSAVMKARAAGVPVVWVQHSDDWMAIGSDDWQIVPELQPAEVLVRDLNASFSEEDLPGRLANAVTVSEVFA